MRPRLTVSILVLLIASGCNASFQIGIEHTPSVPALATQTVIVLPTVTPLIITASLANTLPAPTLPSPPAPTYTRSLPTKTPGPQLVDIYLIAIGDNGQGGIPIGCGDSAIPVKVEIAPTQGVLRAALEKLLSIKDQFFGQSGLYNVLYQSDLQAQDVSINNGVAHIELVGTLMLAGECDSPRVQAELENTIMQFPTVTSAEIFLNGKTLVEALSLK